ncbi:MAG: hypothetical protein ACM3SY_14645 [Candidatus Omnitrophota bacterium]
MKIILISLMIMYCGIVIFPEKVADLPELNKPHAIECDGENFYIVDDTTAHIYSMKGCKHIGSFGQRGEGPYELNTPFYSPARILLLSDKIILSSSNKLVVYTKKGKPIDEKIFRQGYSDLIPFKKNYVAVQVDVDQKSQLVDTYKVLLISPDLKNKELLISFVVPPIGIPNRPGWALPLKTFINVANDNLYVFSMQQDKEIFVFNSEGKQIKRLTVDLPKIKVTEAVKNDMIDYLKSIGYGKVLRVKDEEIKNRCFFRDYLSTAKLCKIKDGIIQLETYEKREGKYQIVLMDLNGKILKKLFLPIPIYDLSPVARHTSYCFDKNTYYYLVDNDETENWELHKISLDKIK